jgi:hypothetical protein
MLTWHAFDQLNELPLLATSRNSCARLTPIRTSPILFLSSQPRSCSLHIAHPEHFRALSRRFSTFAFHTPAMNESEQSVAAKEHHYGI